MGKGGELKYIHETSMGEVTKKEAIKRGAKVRRGFSSRKNPKFGKSFIINDGYNCFENLVVVRKYIQKLYDIDYSTLETLLYLYPKGFFSYADYQAIDKQFHLASTKRLVALGLGKIAFKHGKGSIALYTLTAKSKNIVHKFYDIMMENKTFKIKQAERIFDKKKLGENKTLNLIKQLDSKLND